MCAFPSSLRSYTVSLFITAGHLAMHIILQLTVGKQVYIYCQTELSASLTGVGQPAFPLNSHIGHRLGCYSSLIVLAWAILVNSLFLSFLNSRMRVILITFGRILVIRYTQVKILLSLAQSTELAVIVRTPVPLEAGCFLYLVRPFFFQSKSQRCTLDVSHPVKEVAQSTHS